MTDETNYKNEELYVPMSKNRMIKNVAVLCSGIFLLYTAYDAPTVLQSTMNKQENIGVISQAVIYACFCISTILFPKYIIRKFGSKAAFVFSIILYIPYIAGNFFPHWIVMIPASILLGLGYAVVWNSQAIYLNDISNMFSDVTISKQSSVDNGNISSMSLTESYKISPNSVNCNFSTHAENLKFKSENVEICAVGVSDWKFLSVDNLANKNSTKENITNSCSATDIHEKHIQSDEFQNKCRKEISQADLIDRNENIESIRARLFGIHGMSFLSSHLISNLVSFYILNSEINMNQSLRNSSQICGANYCDISSKLLDNNLAEVPSSTKYILMGFCVTLGIISIIITVLFLDKVKENHSKEKFSFELLMETLKLAKRKELLLLFPYTFYMGLAQGFYTGEFTKIYVGCSLGIHKVPLVSASFGIFSSLSSISSGWIVKLIGRKLFFAINGVINLLSIILFLIWNPDSDQEVTFYLAAGIWGTFVGSFSSQLKAFYFILFKSDQEVAFAVACFWMSIGFCCSIAVTGYFCTYIKIYFLLIVSTLGYLGYLIIEFNLNKSLLN